MPLLDKTTKKLSQTTYGAILPHAGIAYAGDARKSAFTLLKDKYKSKPIKWVIYISAFHQGNSNGTEIYQSYKDTGFSYNFKSNINKKSKMPPN